MAQINTGSNFDTGTGDSLRTAFKTTRENFESWEANFPLSYLFPYTGSARMDGNLILTGSLLYSFDPTSPYSSPSDIDVFTTNIKSNTDITASGDSYGTQTSNFLSYTLPRKSGYGHALYTTTNSAQVGDFPLLQFISNSFSFERQKISLNNVITSAPDVRSLYIGRILNQDFQVNFPFDYGTGTESYYSWRISAPDQTYLMDSTYNPNTQKRHVAIKQPIDFNKYENIQINGDMYVNNVNGIILNNTNTPTQDPHRKGQLFRTGSENLGWPAGFEVICVSQG